MSMIKLILLLAITLEMSYSFAALVPLSPVGGEEIALLPNTQKEVMRLSTLDERIKFLRDGRKHDKAHFNGVWRKSLTLDLQVKTTSGENGPWKVLIGKRPDLSDARCWYLKTTKTDAATGREKESGTAKELQKIEIPMANLEIATRYYWKVVSRGSCGFGCGPKHGCKECKKLVESGISDFITEDLAPRWIEIEGRVRNMRDFGGRIGHGGRRVRQGLVYRGQGLNDNSVTGEVQGRNRLMVEDVQYLTKTLGIKTDLDLRGSGEIADMMESPLGADVKLINRPSPSYKGIFEPKGKEIMAANFRVFCDRKNYPIYFHCIGGADRTGALAYVLGGALGVSRQALETDWESTFYPTIPDENPDPNFWCRESHFNAGFEKYGDAHSSWNERIVLYMKDCGITDEEIAEFREIMLVDAMER